MTEIFPGISTLPNVCGGEPCITNTRIPVWLLVQAHNLGTLDESLLGNYPSLAKIDLQNAWAYAQAHPQEIRNQIKENENA